MFSNYHHLLEPFNVQNTSSLKDTSFIFINKHYKSQYSPIYTYKISQLIEMYAFVVSGLDLPGFILYTVTLINDLIRVISLFFFCLSYPVRKQKQCLHGEANIS